MKEVIKNLFFGLFVMATTNVALAANKGTQEIDMARVLSHYTAIQEKLASDTIDGIKSGADGIKTAVQETKMASKIESLSNKLGTAKNLTEAREAFKDLSGALVPLFEKKKQPGFEIVSCPMAKAKWIQRSGDIKNPYYGKEMLSCGEKVS